jgi:hypothetical protein
LVLIGLLAVLGLVASAADETAPTAKGPTDLPGADVIWYQNQQYTLNATGSSDDVGIVRYQWEIFSPTNVRTSINSTTPTATWTPTQFGIYKVVSWVFDAVGNKGFYVFAMDVVEVITAQTYSGGTYSYDHSVAVTVGTLAYSDCTIQVTGGKKAEGASVTKGEQMSEDVTYKGGALSGHWANYYDQSYYGKLSKDTSVKLIGSASVKVDTGDYGYSYGAEYVFDQPTDLSGYNTFVFWIKCVQGGYPQLYYPYMYSGGRSTGYSGYCYRYSYIIPPSTSSSGWFGVSLSLDITKVGYGYDYNFDITQVGSVWLYMWSYYTEWIDCAYFSKEVYSDNITESVNPTGAWAGSWSTSTGSVAASSNRYVGSSSVQFTASSSGYQYLYYKWNNPVDLSSYNALRLFNYYSAYYYCYNYGVYFYSASGYAYCPYSTYFHMYASYLNSRWYLANIAFDKGMYYNYGVDWTKITRMEFDIYHYYAPNLLIDGLEFYKAQSATAGVPTLSENIPCGIYALQGGQLKMTNVKFTSSSPFGAFVRCDSNLEITDSTFDGLWGTKHASIKTTAQTYGGILCFNANQVKLKGVVITKASSSGMYVENSNIDASNLDFSNVGVDYPGAAAMIVSFRDTAVMKASTVKVSNSDFHDSPGGSGLMVLSQDARGDGTVTFDDVTATNNGVYGVSMEVVGYTGNLTVTVKNSAFQLNKGSGFAFVMHDARPQPKTAVKFNVEDSDSFENGAYGFLFQVAKANVKATGTLTNTESYDNEGNGIGFDIASIAGELNLNFKGLNSHENVGNGMYLKVSQTSFTDSVVGKVLADGRINLDFADCRFGGNDGNGVYEQHYFYGSTTEAVIEHYNLKATNLVVEKNGGHGYYVGPYGSAGYASRDNNWVFKDSLFTDNTRDGFYVYEYSYNYGKGYGSSKEHFNFYNCTFTYNTRGIEQYWQGYSYGVMSWVTVKGCTFQDNDYECLKATGAWYSYYDSGTSFLQWAEYDVQDTLLDGYVYLDISGDYDYGGAWVSGGAITFINDTYTSDVPMFLRQGSYAYSGSSSYSLTYDNVKHTSPSTGDGVYVQMYGGEKVTGRVDIANERFDNPLGNGVHVRMGTLYPYTGYTMYVTGRVSVTDVDIIDPAENGLFIETKNRLPTGTITKGSYSLLRTTVTNCDVGVKSASFDGEIRSCKFINPKSETIYTYYGVIDVYESKVGAIKEENLRVDEKGAIRLWFELGVKVVWKGTTEFVKGASVEIKDNTWNIIGINAIDSPEGILFTNLNSYTVLPEGIYTKNPYIITVDYIGIVKESRVTVDKNMDVTIEIVDDIQPRLTIETPKDGQEQREPTILVKGTAYDKHTGLDRVVVSIDGHTWARATIGVDGFTYTYTVTDAPEGLTVVTVRSYDVAGNNKELSATVLVDSTPPALGVITPTDGMRTSKRTLEIVGTTDVGARVYINDRPIQISYTLISYSMILAEGPNAIKVAAVDYLGNVNQVVRYVTLDTQAPYIAMVTEDSTVSSPTVTVVGMTEPVDVTIKVAGSPAAVDADGRFTATVTLKDGANKIDVYGVDGVGNERHIALMLTLDRTAPWVRLISPSGDVVTDKDLRVEGFVELGAKVFVNEREVDTSFGHFATTVSATEGPFNLHIVAMDGAGNEVTMDKALIIDTVAPALEVRTPVDGFVTNSPTIEVAGSISLGGERAADVRFIELYVAGVPRLFNFQTGEFAQEVTLEEGVNHILVRAMDPAGNEATLTRTVMLDSEAPYLSVQISNTRMDPNWNEPVSLSDFVYVSGFTEVGAALSVNGVSVQVDRETGSFNYSLDLAAPTGGLRIATTTVRVVATDAAGNAAIREQDVNRLVETGPAKKAGANAAQWMVLMLALVIFGLSFVGAISYQRMQSQEEMIEALEARPPAATVTPEGKALSPPPARPVRGGRARQKAPEAPKPEQGKGAEGGKDDVVVDLEGEK